MSKFLTILFVAACLIAALIYSQQQVTVNVVSGFIESDEVRLGSRVGGRVKEVFVEEGDVVAAGDVLVELEPYDLENLRSQAEAELSGQLARHEQLVEGYRDEEIAQSEARLTQAIAELQRLQNGPRPQELDAARADVELASAELTLAEENLDRAKALKATNATSQEAYDRAQSDWKVAQARLKAKTKQLELLEEGTRQEELDAAKARVDEATAARDLMKNGYLPQEIAAAYAAQRVAESARDIVETQLSELKVIAPSHGTVDAIDLHKGDLMTANAPAISIVDTTRLWVRAYVPENLLNLSIGDILPVTVDSYPQEIFQGEVRFISRQAEFTPSNVQTPEERSKQVFRIKVVVNDPDGKLRPGMAADLRLEREH